MIFEIPLHAGFYQECLFSAFEQIFSAPRELNIYKRHEWAWDKAPEERHTNFIKYTVM